MKWKGFMAVLAGAILLVAGCAGTDDRAPAGKTRLTAGELDAVSSQLEKCWQVPTGAPDPETMVVVIKVQVNRDRTVKSAAVVDSARMETDMYFREMAESAMRALLNAHCSPLKLPPEKYDAWKVTTITFDPREMLRR